MPAGPGFRIGSVALVYDIKKIDQGIIARAASNECLSWKMIKMEDEIRQEVRHAFGKANAYRLFSTAGRMFNIAYTSISHIRSQHANGLINAMAPDISKRECPM